LHLKVQVLDELLVPVAYGDLGDLGGLGYLALGALFVVELAGYVDAGSCDALRRPAYGELLFVSLVEDAAGQLLGGSSDAELADELGDEVVPVYGGYVGPQLLVEEPVVASGLLAGDVGGPGYVLEAAHDVALAAGHVEGGRYDGLDGSASDELLGDGSAVDHGGGLGGVLG